MNSESPDGRATTPVQVSSGNSKAASGAPIESEWYPCQLFGFVQAKFLPQPNPEWCPNLEIGGSIRETARGQGEFDTDTEKWSVSLQLKKPLVVDLAQTAAKMAIAYQLKKGKP